MKTSILVARTFRILSVLAFVIILFLSYVSLPPDIAVHYDITGRPDVFITKSQLFYGLTAFVVIFNIAFSVLATLIPAIPVGRLSLFNRDFWLQHRQVFRDIFTSWMLSFIGLINLFLIVFLVVIRLLNTSEDIQVFNYRWVVIVGGIVLLGWLAFLPIRLMVRSAAVAEE
jgi:uncharacterized membrane protein